METKTKSVFWRPWTDSGLEHLRIKRFDNGIVVEGFIVRILNSVGFHANYRINASATWKFRSVDLTVSTDHDRHMSLSTDGEGNWQDQDGNELSNLRECFEIDISATPFTNTLAIGRLNIGVGKSVKLSAAYIRLPEMTVEAVPQRYTAVEISKRRSAYRYEGLFRNFTAILPVDEDLIVIDYPETFKRIFL
jgi:hypothetical protein